jgi:hypothetical protein
MRIVVRQCFAPSPIASALANLFSSVSKICAALPEFNSTFTADADVVVTLGDRDQFDRWHVRADALGFHAVASGTQYDTEEDELEGVNGWIDVNEKNEAVINIGAAVELCREHASEGSDEDDDAAFMVSMIVTPIHEIMHVAEFLEKSRGRSPIEVFDEDLGEAGLRAILEDDDAEDRVEAISLGIAEHLYSSSAAIRSAVADVMTTVSRGRKTRAGVSI